MRTLSSTHEDTLSLVHRANENFIRIFRIYNERFIFPESIKCFIILILRRHINILVNPGIIPTHINNDPLPHSWNLKIIEEEKKNYLEEQQKFEK